MNEAKQLRKIILKQYKDNLVRDLSQNFKNFDIQMSGNRHLSRDTDRGLVSIDGNVVHLVEVVVQETLLGVGLDDLAQRLPAQLLRWESGRLAIDPVWRPEGGKRKEESRNEGKKKRSRHGETCSNFLCVTICYDGTQTN